MDRKKLNTLLIILGGVILALAVGFIYSVQKTSEKDRQMKEMEQVMAFEKQQLENEYKTLAVEFDGYTVNIKNDSLLQLFDQERAKVKQLLDELKTTKASDAKRISELKAELSSARKVIMRYVARIDSLNSVNKSLTAENKTVKDQYFAESSKNELLEMEQKKLKETVAKAAILDVNNFSVTPLDKKNRRTDRTGRTTNLQMNFTVGKNVTTDPGTKIIYLRLIRPDGNLMTKSPDTFFEYKGKEIGYSLSKDIVFKGNSVDEVLFWKVEEPLLTGTYQADFFIDGNSVGSYTFKLEKK